MNRLFNKSLVLVALVGAMTAFGTRAEAAFLTGQVNYTGDATYNASSVDFGDTDIQSVTGDFAVLIPDGDPIDHEDPFVYNPFPGGGYTPLWSHIASGVTFDLSTLNVDFNNGNTLVLSGTGVFHAAGFDDTAALWNMTVNQLDGIGSFSASSAVPEVPEPMTLGLLGLGLAGLAARRKRA
jgi:hypothetical protein